MSTKFTCRFCNEQFDVPKGLYKHLQLVHNAGLSRDSRTCPICGVVCSKYESYRDHLLYIHGQTDDGQKLTFKSLNEFLVWKAELELKHSCKYVLQASPKVLPTKEKKYFYKCDSSNSKKSKDKKSLSVVMKTCSSVISVVEGAGAFKVEYWDTHSGHNEPSVESVQNELDAVISSVEMVNAIGDSDDSFDRSEELFIPESPSPSISNIEKQTFIRTSSPINANSSPFEKTKFIQTLGKLDSAKKKTNTKPVLFSLASVACGKGIVKKPAAKSGEKKSLDSQSTLEVDSKDGNKKSIVSSEISVTVTKQKDDSILKEPVVTNDSTVTTTATTIVTTTPSSSVTIKTTSSGPAAIAPKISPVAGNTLNSLFASNGAFSNQFVIMNPASVAQNSLTPSQNVFTAGQNILLSLGPVGQNSPFAVTSQTKTPISASEVKQESSADNKKSETSSKVNTSKVSTPAKKFNNTQTVSSVMTSTIGSNSAITLTPGLNNSPVFLSSLPVGSTFMSVNNNLIPIASPSGTFIPNTLPPNIVLTPVVPGASSSNKKPSTTTSANTVTITPILDTEAKKPTSPKMNKNEISITKVSTPNNAQTQARLTAPSTAAVTVSSFIREPLYTSSVVSRMSNIITPSTPPTSSKNSKQRTQNKFVPITTASRISPVKTVDKSLSSPKGSSNASKSKNSSNSVADKIEINSITASKRTYSKLSTPASKKSVPDTSSILKPKASARKGTPTSKDVKVKAHPIETPANDISSAFSTKVVNSRLHLTPISSTTNVTMTPQGNTQKPGTMLFESAAGEIYMLEPIENEEISAKTKKSTVPETPVIKIDSSVQTTESSSLLLRSKCQRKRAAPPTDDSAVMLKVKCYQLEMKYLNSRTECKRLKVELTKERLKNAELSGKSATNLEDENESLNTNADEIMKEIEDRFNENKDASVYTLTKTSVLRSLYEDLEEVILENNQLYKELENYRAHDKFYKNLKKRLHDEEF